MDLLRSLSLVGCRNLKAGMLLAIPRLLNEKGSIGGKTNLYYRQGILNRRANICKALTCLLSLTISCSFLVANPTVTSTSNCPTNFNYLNQVDWLRSKTAKVKTLLVLAPGAGIPTEAYRDLAKTLIDTFPGDLGVGIIRFTGLAPNPMELVSGAQRSSQLAKSCGMDSGGSVFLAGHALGGVLVQKVARKLKPRGILLLASFLKKAESPEIGSEDLTAYRWPVLTLGGELDGTTRPGWIFNEFEKFNALFNTQGVSALRNKPVIILPELNHGSFMDGRKVARDLTSPVPTALGHNQIANVANAFISLNSPELSKKKRLSAINLLKELVQATEKLTDPYRKAKARDKQLCYQLFKMRLQSAGWNHRFFWLRNKKRSRRLGRFTQ